MSSDRIAKMLSGQDASILDSRIENSWIPKDPTELILPYIGKDVPVERNSLEFRREKAKEVYDGYRDIIAACKEQEDDISERCKNVKISLDASKHRRAIEALERVFGTEGLREITFDMYKAVIHEMAALNNGVIPKPGEV